MTFPKGRGRGSFGRPTERAPTVEARGCAGGCGEALVAMDREKLTAIAELRGWSVTGNHHGATYPTSFWCTDCAEKAGRRTDPSPPLHIDATQVDEPGQVVEVTFSRCTRIGDKHPGSWVRYGVPHGLSGPRPTLGDRVRSTVTLDNGQQVVGDVVEIDAGGDPVISLLPHVVVPSGGGPEVPFPVYVSRDVSDCEVWVPSGTLVVS